MTAFIVNSTEQYEVALQTLADRFTKRCTALRKQYTARMQAEAWGDPALAEAIRTEWDAELEGALAAHKQAIDAVPKPPKQEKTL